tara:strand:- start:650 stop:913 length:264 start_codon:yes stop_codon:yes gene_type:complete
MEKNKILAVAASASIGLVSGAATAKPDWAAAGVKVEKCSGVAKKAGNDCHTNAHACAGQAAKDNDPKEWVYVPQGLCQKLAKGKVIK